MKHDRLLGKWKHSNKGFHVYRLLPKLKSGYLQYSITLTHITSLLTSVIRSRIIAFLRNVTVLVTYGVFQSNKNNLQYTVERHRELSCLNGRQSVTVNFESFACKMEFSSTGIRNDIDYFRVIIKIKIDQYFRHN